MITILVVVEQVYLIIFANDDDNHDKQKTMIIMKIIASNEWDGMPYINYLFHVIGLLLQPYQN